MTSSMIEYIVWAKEGIWTPYFFSDKNLALYTYMEYKDKNIEVIFTLPRDIIWATPPKNEQN